MEYSFRKFSLVYVKNNKRNAIINLLLHSLGILLGKVPMEISYSLTSIGELTIALQELDKRPFTKKSYICLHFVPFASVPVHRFFLHELLMSRCE